MYGYGYGFGYTRIGNDIFLLNQFPADLLHGSRQLPGVAVHRHDSSAATAASAAAVAAASACGHHSRCVLGPSDNIWLRRPNANIGSCLYDARRQFERISRIND